MSTEDYKAHLRLQKQKRLEVISANTLAGILASGLNMNVSYDQICKIAIESAKELIKQLDEEYK